MKKKAKETVTKQEIKIENGTDNKVTMIKDGKGKRFHKDLIAEMQCHGWKLP